MEQPRTPPVASRAVTVEFRDGKWIVGVLDDDERHEREFLIESHAISYADGQRLRLGIFQR